ncbi:unnamed protein product [Trichobilharzia szidati]|nr:unnamed protein product [Trichobilharzia szidati]
MATVTQMKNMTLVFLILLCSAFDINAIYEDQVNVLDWLQKYTGKVKYSRIKFDGATPKGYYVGSELNVISSISLKDGSVVWRQVLEEGGFLTAFELCDNRLFSISSKHGTKLRAWDAKTGSVLWEALLDSSESYSGNIWCDGHSDVLVVAYENGIDIYRLRTGEKLSSDRSKNPDFVGQISTYSKRVESNVSISVFEEHYRADEHKNGDAKTLSYIIAKTFLLSNSGLHLTPVVTKNYTVYSPKYNQISCHIHRKFNDKAFDDRNEASSVLVCLASEHDSKRNVLRFSSVSPSSSSITWNVVTVNNASPRMVRLTDEYFLLTSTSLESAAGTVYYVDSSGSPVAKYSVSNAMVGCLGTLNGRSYLFTLHHNSNQDFKNLALSVYDLESGELSKQLAPRQFTLAGHHGAVESMSVIMFTDASGEPSFRLLLCTEDNAVQLIRQNGKQQWIREEALANIVAVEVVDLPVSEFQAKIEEEFSHTSNNIIEMFVRRLKTQMSQLLVWAKHWITNLLHLLTTLTSSTNLSDSLLKRSTNDMHSRKYPSQQYSSNDLTSSDNYPNSLPPRWQFSSDAALQTSNYTDEDNDNNNNHKTKSHKSTSINPKMTWDEMLTRDNFNVHKMLVVATSVGKVFGLESERGRVVWDYFVPSAALLANGKLALFQQRNLAHFPLPPVMSLLFRSKTTNLPMVFSFNPITGVPSRETDMSMYSMNSNIIQAVLQPGPVSEKCKFIRPLLFLKTDLEVEVYPSYCVPAFASSDSTPLHIYTVESQEARLSGYRILLKSPNSNSLRAVRTWRIQLSSDSSSDNKQFIVSAAARPPSEHIYLVGRVLGDRSVLYKYLNPNLIAVVTTGGHVSNHTNTVMIYLIDVVVGRILYSAVHRRCSEPVSLVHSENWIVYTYYNHKSLRNEVTVIELYEPTKLSGELCASHSIPSPGQLFLSNLIPSWLSTSSSKSDSNSVSSRFSSLFRASDVDGFCGSTGENSLVPQVFQQSYILSTPPRSGAAAVSITDRGITSKNIIFALQKNSLIELPKSFFDPRRSLDMTPELMEEGVHPYAPVLPLSDQAMISYNQSVMRIRAIRTAPTGLESTGLVFAYGLDVFFTRISPSQTYDLLKEDFDYTAIATVTLGMIVASIVCCRLANRRLVFRAWA